MESSRPLLAAGLLLAGCCSGCWLAAGCSQAAGKLAAGKLAGWLLAAGSWQAGWLLAGRLLAGLLSGCWLAAGPGLRQQGERVVKSRVLGPTMKQFNLDAGSSKQQPVSSMQEATERLERTEAAKAEPHSRVPRGGRRIIVSAHAPRPPPCLLLLEFHAVVLTASHSPKL